MTWECSLHKLCFSFTCCHIFVGIGFCCGIVDAGNFVVVGCSLVFNSLEVEASTGLCSCLGHREVVAGKMVLVV